MCGIGCAVNRTFPVKLVEAIKRRGPNLYQCHRISINEISLEAHGAVLHLRGDTPCSQPVIFEDSSFLLWNGEIFGGALKVAQNESDTRVLGERLSQCVSDTDVLTCFASIEGPFSFLFYQSSLHRLWYGRDFFGRRSLLKCQSEPRTLFFSSCAPCGSITTSWQEVPATGIFFLDLNTFEEVEIAWGQHESLPKPIPLMNPSVFVDETFSSLASAAIESTFDLLVASVRKRLEVATSCKDNPVAILFSGGIDSMIMARIVDHCLDEDLAIELINVAFENPRVLKQQSDKSMTFNVPDRQTGLLGVAELRRLVPHRTWHFVQVNVPFSECEAARSHVSTRLHPHDTVMDLSIGIALWFAARGCGVLDITGKDYLSLSKILFVGIGADELFGGYGRHTSSFSHGGWPRLLQEMQLDLDRIGSRNLGRDDRCMSDHGKEARFPFLDEPLVRHIAALPVFVKWQPDSYQSTIGNKWLLRQIGLKKCGFSQSICAQPKRAIQFGAKTARMVDSKETGQQRLR